MMKKIITGYYALFSISAWSCNSLFIFPKAIAVIALAVFLLVSSVSDLLAGEMTGNEALGKMPKLSISGYVEGIYDDYQVKAGSSSSHGYQFGEHLHLEAMGFLVDRRLLAYGLGLDYQRWDGSRTSDTWGISLNMVVLPFQPMRTYLWASYGGGGASGGDSYEYRTAGFSMSYSRKVIPLSLIQEMSKQRERELEQKRRQRQQQQEEEEEEEGQGAGQPQGKKNIAQKKKKEEEVEKPQVAEEVAPKLEKGFLYYFLPKIFTFDFDAYSVTVGGSSSSAYSANFQARGDYGKTSYNLRIADVYRTVEDRGSQNSISLSLSTQTRVNLLYLAGIDTGAFFAKSGPSSAYGVSAGVSGFLTQSRKWEYGMVASYGVTDGETSMVYSFSTSAADYGSSEWRNTRFSYRFGLGYGRTAGSTFFDGANLKTSEDSVYGYANLGTSTPVTTKLSVGTSSSVTADINGSYFGFAVGASYRPTPRLSLNARYSISGRLMSWNDSNDNAVTTFYGSNSLPVTGTENDVFQAIDVSASYYHDRVTLSSGLGVVWTSNSESDRWSTSASTSIWKLSVVIGADFLRDKTLNSSDPGSTEAKSYNFFGTVTGPFFFRNSTFSIASAYSKSDSKSLFSGAQNTTKSWTTSTFISWFWRKLIITADGRYIITEAGNGPKTTDRRITLRVSRSFRVL